MVLDSILFICIKKFTPTLIGYHKNTGIAMAKWAFWVQDTCRRLKERCAPVEWRTDSHPTLPEFFTPASTHLPSLNSLFYGASLRITEFILRDEGLEAELIYGADLRLVEATARRGAWFWVLDAGQWLYQSK